MFDFLMGLIFLGLIGPLCMIIALANWGFLGRPIFFRQQRVGHFGKSFWILKFRTLPVEGHEVAHKRPLSSYGRFLRKFSLDELPSLWNILKGDVSIVGPRPLMTEFFSPPWRSQVRPGMTGLAQIRGRNAIGWRQKFRYDLFYIKHRSFALDLYILAKTLPLLFSAEGTEFASPENYAPRESDDCASS